MKTAIEKLEALFYNKADFTINSNSWVIHERALKKIILAAKEIEKEQIIKAWEDGSETEYQYHVNGEFRKCSFDYYNQTFNQNES